MIGVIVVPGSRVRTALSKSEIPRGCDAVYPRLGYSGAVFACSQAISCGNAKEFV